MLHPAYIIYDTIKCRCYVSLQIHMNNKLNTKRISNINSTVFSILNYYVFTLLYYKKRTQYFRFAVRIRSILKISNANEKTLLAFFFICKQHVLTKNANANLCIQNDRIRDENYKEANKWCAPFCN